MKSPGEMNRLYLIFFVIPLGLTRGLANGDFANETFTSDTIVETIA